MLQDCAKGFHLSLRPDDRRVVFQTAKFGCGDISALSLVAEMAANTLAVRSRKAGDLGSLPVDNVQPEHTTKSVFSAVASAAEGSTKEVMEGSE